MNQDLPENVTDGIIKVGSTFKSKYGSISIFACVILSRDFNFNKILKTKCSQPCLTFICQDGDWALSNGSLDSDLSYLDNVLLVENGNLKLAESIFSFISHFNKIKHNNHIQFNKSYKMAVLFKLNDSDFQVIILCSFVTIVCYCL